MEKNSNPYQGPERVIESGPVKSTVAPVLAIVGFVSLAALGVLLVVASLIPMGRGGSARHASLRNACLHNLRTIALGLQKYEADHGSLPPAYTLDANGNRLHSWRTLILPYVDENRLYEKIDLSKAWDDPVHAEARAAEVLVYTCPSSYRDVEMTTYLAVMGKDFAFDGPQGRKSSELPNGTESIVALVDVDSDHAVHWMSPQDADMEMLLSIPGGKSIHHPGILLTAFIDGHVALIPLDAKSEKWRAVFQKWDAE